MRQPRTVPKPASATRAERRLEAPRAGGRAGAGGALPSGSPELIAGRYRVEGFLGRGGRKRVYRASDAEGGDRDVAVAVFDTEEIGETVLARARREAQAMGKLGEHPHIVRVLDSGEDGGVPFVVSEYVGGGDLAGVLEDCAGRRLELEPRDRDRRSTSAGRSSTPTRAGSSTAT